MVKTFSRWLEESNNNSGMDEALEFVLGFILGGRNKEIELSTAAQSWLKSTVKEQSLVLFRGMYLMNNRADKSLFDKYNSLKEGDVLPAELQSTLIKPYSKKEAVAKSYAKEGNLVMITKTTVPKSNIIADLEQIPSILKGVDQDILDESDFKYLKRDKEVMVREPVNHAMIIMKKGKLS